MKQGLPKTLKLSREKRAAVSELLSIGELATDPYTNDLISTRVAELLGAGKVWLLTDDSIKEALTKLIERHKAETWSPPDPGV